MFISWTNEGKKINHPLRGIIFFVYPVDGWRENIDNIKEVKMFFCLGLPSWTDEKGKNLTMEEKKLTYQGGKRIKKEKIELNAVKIKIEMKI